MYNVQQVYCVQNIVLRTCKYMHVEIHIHYTYTRLNTEVIAVIPGLYFYRILCRRFHVLRNKVLCNTIRERYIPVARGNCKFHVKRLLHIIKVLPTYNTPVTGMHLSIIALPDETTTK